jgi:hypothetical protein
VVPAALAETEVHDDPDSVMVVEVEPELLVAPLPELEVYAQPLV